MTEKFAELVAQAQAADVTGWGFSWLDGRAREQRPSWGYQRAMGRRLGRVTAALDLQTGGGEVLAESHHLPPVMAATEAWPPNLAKATALLRPRGVVVVANDAPPLPFADHAFDLVTSRHPVTVWWEEIARVLRDGGGYFAQHVGPASMFELVEHFLGPRPDAAARRDSRDEKAQARAAGLEIVDVRTERLRAEFGDIGAVVYFLRKVIWTIPDFTVDKYRDRLWQLHDQIQREGVFVAHSSRTLFEARKPDRGRPAAHRSRSARRP